MQGDLVDSASNEVRMAIAIPAFGRPASIVANLTEMAAEARSSGLSIAFYVSDDTPDSSVEEALQNLIADGLAVHYRRNIPSLGHDLNLISTLQWPDAEYVWIMGDRYRARPGILASMIRFLDGQDLVFLSAHANSGNDILAIAGDKARALLREVLWHQTLTGATIYGRSVRRWVADQGNSLVIVRNFPQICIMLGFSSTFDPVIGWFSKHALQASNSGESSYWYTKAIDVFGRDWSQAVSSFPRVVDLSHRASVIREHSLRTDLFNTYNLVTLRQSGQFKWSSLRDRGTREAMHLPRWKLLLILVLPIRLLRLGGITLKFIKQRLSAGSHHCAS